MLMCMKMFLKKITTHFHAFGFNFLLFLYKYGIVIVRHMLRRHNLHRFVYLYNTFSLLNFFRYTFFCCFSVEQNYVLLILRFGSFVAGLRHFNRRFHTSISAACKYTRKSAHMEHAYMQSHICEQYIYVYTH